MATNTRSSKTSQPQDRSNSSTSQQQQQRSETARRLAQEALKSSSRATEVASQMAYRTN